MKKVREITHITFCDETAPEMRAYHVGKYTATGRKNIYVHRFDELAYETLSMQIIFRSLKWLLTFQVSLFINIFKPCRYDFSWITSSFHEGLQLIFLPGKNNFFYLSLSSHSYLSAYFSSEIQKERTWFITSNSPMYRPMRYTFLPSATIALCSKYQKEEIEFYLENHWIICCNHSLWGLEEDIELDTSAESEAYDLLVFSSAEWARNEKYWREKDLDKIRSGVTEKSIFYRIFEEMVLDTAIELKKENMHLKIILLPHPYERELIRKHGLLPPYLDKIREAGIHYESGAANSLQYLKNAKSAVAECSTIIFDSWQYDIPAFTYSGAGHKDIFKVDYDYRYLGRYREFCFSSKEELKKKLKDVLVCAV